jgi:hypothetical protein
MNPCTPEVLGVFGLCVVVAIVTYFWGWIDGGHVRKMDQANCKHCGGNNEPT